MACPHGFAPEECLICQTLDTKDGGRTAVKAPDLGATSGGYGAPGALPAAPRRESHPGGSGRGETRRTGGARHFGYTVLAIVALVIALWLVSGLVFSLIRVAESFIVALIAAVLGYVYGVARTHRKLSRRKER